MTATESINERKSAPALPAWRHALLFGTGLGIAMGARDLNVVLVRTRPSGPTLLAETTIPDFRTRPAAEWGSELLRFLAASGQSRLAATALLPRDEVIVRTLNLPGVADKDVPAAIDLQIETLHPWGDEEVTWGWSRAGATAILVGIVRKTMLETYETLFSEAGIPLAAITFSPAVVHAALRIWSAAPESVLCFTAAQNRTEVYGESSGRAIYSAEFSADRDRALAVSRAELRLAPDCPAVTLADALPKPAGGAAVTSALAWAAGLAGSTARFSKFANVLPPERRASHDRMQYLFPIVLGSALVLALIAAFIVVPAIDERRYRDDLSAAVRALEPTALRAQNLDKRIAADRARIAALDDFRRRSQSDLDVLNELTKLLPPPVWTSSIEIFPDSVIISGEADQAAPLLKILDSSPLFQNSEFPSSVTRNKDSELFRIRTIRRGRARRVTP
ncbi:MAG TPA: PilN domain-containing protein [Bryobacteraceae bacterium]|jgi:Tfp pilus assembly protein PilN|nr:PilN domain-containing protein [Bryobacteraceae bacterium]